jgi:hypothetical protein
VAMAVVAAMEQLEGSLRLSRLVDRSALTCQMAISSWISACLPSQSTESPQVKTFEMTSFHENGGKCKI